jgi:serine/threonine-protein kinase
MIVEFISFYLVFIIVSSILMGWIFLRSKKPLSRRVLVLLTLLLLVPLPVGYFYVAYFDALPEVVVPDVTGQGLVAAEGQLTAVGLRSRHAGSVFDTRYPEGLTVSQRPEAGRKVKIGRIINLLTSSGRRKVQMPNLLGRPVTQAESVVSSQGLVLGETRYEYAAEVDPGLVLVQMPLPGETVEAETVVFMTVSASAEIQSSPAEGQEEQKEDQGGFKLWW